MTEKLSFIFRRSQLSPISQIFKKVKYVEHLDNILVNSSASPLFLFPYLKQIMETHDVIMEKHVKNCRIMSADLVAPLISLPYAYKDNDVSRYTDRQIRELIYQDPRETHDWYKMRVYIELAQAVRIQVITSDQSWTPCLALWLSIFNSLVNGVGILDF